MGLLHWTDGWSPRFFEFLKHQQYVLYRHGYLSRGPEGAEECCHIHDANFNDVCISFFFLIIVSVWVTHQQDLQSFNLSLIPWMTKVILLRRWAMIDHMVEGHFQKLLTQWVETEPDSKLDRLFQIWWTIYIWYIHIYYIHVYYAYHYRSLHLIILFNVFFFWELPYFRPAHCRNIFHWAVCSIFIRFHHGSPWRCCGLLKRMIFRNDL